MTNLSNPKSLIFFGSIFGSVLGANPSPALRLAMVAVVIVDAIVWHVGLAIACSHPAVRKRYATIRPTLDMLIGLLFALLRLGLIARAATNP